MLAPSKHLSCQEHGEKIDPGLRVCEFHLQLLRRVACHSSERRLIGQCLLQLLRHGGYSLRVALLQALNFGAQLLFRCTRSRLR